MEHKHGLMSSFKAYRRLLNQTTPKSLGWKSRDRSTPAEIYGDLKKSSEIIRKMRLEFVGLRSENQPVGKLMLWQSSNPLKKGQDQRYTQIKQIDADLPQLTLEEIKMLSQNRDLWKDAVCEAKNTMTPATQAD